MFDLFSATTEQVNEVSKHFSIHTGAIIYLLISKGIVTEEEVKQAIAMATASVDQEWQRRVDEQRKENPGLALFEKVLGGGE